MEHPFWYRMQIAARSLIKAPPTVLNMTRPHSTKARVQSRKYYMRTQLFESDGAMFKRGQEISIFGKFIVLTALVPNDDCPMP